MACFPLANSEIIERSNCCLEIHLIYFYKQALKLTDRSRNHLLQ